MKFNIEEKLNEQNSQLLLLLRHKMEIEFACFEESYAQVYTIKNHNTISINPELFTNSSVAHELLHVWFNSLNSYSSNSIYYSARKNIKLHQILDKNLCDFIGNCMEHYKIYPKFLEMGYLQEDFLSTHGMQCPLSSIRNLQIIMNNVYSPKVINRYIGLLISIYADHLPFDYSQHLELMKQKEPHLFDIVTNFWNAWMHIDIEEKILKRTDSVCFNDFITDMQEWI